MKYAWQLPSLIDYLGKEEKMQFLRKELAFFLLGIISK